MYLICLSLVIVIAAPQVNCYGQNHLRIYEDIGGGGSSADGSGSTDNTFIYVAGGLLVAGVLAYALFLKKDDKEESDTISVSSTSEILNNRFMQNPYSEIEKAKDEIPVDIFLGIKDESYLMRGKTYLVGFSFKL